MQLSREAVRAAKRCLVDYWQYRRQLSLCEDYLETIHYMGGPQEVRVSLITSQAGPQERVVMAKEGDKEYRLLQAIVRTIERGLVDLNQRQRNCVDLAYRRGRDVRDICRMLDISQATYWREMDKIINVIAEPALQAQALIVKLEKLRARRDQIRNKKLCKTW